MGKILKRIGGYWPVGFGGIVVAFVVFGVRFLNRPPVEMDPQGQIGVQWIKPGGSEAGYIGSAACQPCHARECQNYLSSPHARTLQAIAPGEQRQEFGSNQTVFDDLNGIVYSVRKGGGKNQVAAKTERTTYLGTARWVFGSGTHAWSYLTQDDAKFLQLRITYYPADDSWNYTPGSGRGAAFHEPLGDPFTPAQAAACFGCHSTVLIGTRERLDLAHSILNVGCESCHGPCRSHVESESGKDTTAGGKTVTPRKHTGAEIMQLCGECHRVPIAGSQANAMGESQLARFPGVALPRSRCFTESGGALSCITCHDPHESTSQQQLPSFDRKCLTCHTAPHGTSCTLGHTSDCVSCHMPDQDIARKLPLHYHNHWIRKDPMGLN